jgi:hypothetical protein
MSGTSELGSFSSLAYCIHCKVAMTGLFMLSKGAMTLRLNMVSHKMLYASRIHVLHL